MTFGTRFAVTYAALRHEVLTVPAKTTVRAKPRILAAMVSPPISSAARPMPAPGLRAAPDSAAARGPNDGTGRGRHRCGRVRRGPSAQHVQPVQGRRSRDHLREADLLAGGRQPGHDAEHGQP